MDSGLLKGIFMCSMFLGRYMAVVVLALVIMFVVLGKVVVWLIQ